MANDLLMKAVRALAGVCDGAASQDGCGFNGTDTAFGHSLARLAQWSPAQEQAAYRMIGKYRGQLAGMGIEFAAIPLPPVATPAMTAQVQPAPKPPEKIDIASLAEWSPARRVQTKYGPRDVRTAKVNDAFSQVWKVRKEEVKKLGATFSKDQSGEWQLTWWQEVPNGETTEQKAAQNAIAEKLRQSAGNLASLLPCGRVLYKHQQESVVRCLENHRQILGLEMGTGKTFIALVTAKAWSQAFGYPIIVVAPVSLRDNWFREAEMVGVAIEVHSWAKVPKPLEHSKYVFIADECHYAQAGKKSQRGAAYLELATNPNCAAHYALTGTPIKNGRPINLLPLLQGTKHRLAENVRHYHEHYCAAKATRFSKWDVTGAAHLGELHANIQDVLIRRTKKECLDLPEKTNIFRKVEMSAQSAKLYADTLAALKAEYERRLDAGEIMTGAEALVQMGQLRRAGSLAKVETAQEMAEEILEQGRQVVIFTEFRESAQKLHNALGGELLMGDTPTGDRQGMVDRFQSGQSRVFISTIKAGGVGITLTAASDVILVDRAWTPGDVAQAIDRLHRIGQHNSVMAFWLQANGCDETIDALLVSKQERIELVLSGKRRSMRGVTGNPGEMAQEVLNVLFG